MGRAYQNKKESMAKTSDMKAKIYSRFSREIYVCAKAGGADVDGNLALRGLIDRAKRSQVPAHVIDKAVDKAKSGGGEDFSTARYEGFGPGGCMVLIDCLTDNPNRTFGDVRQCFTKTKTKIGTQGTVSHMFDHSAIVSFKGDDEDAILETLLLADVDVSDIECEDGEITVFAPHTEFFKLTQALKESMPDIAFDVDEIQFIPQNLAPIPESEMEQFERFLSLLNSLDDVQNIYHNVELAE